MSENHYACGCVSVDGVETVNCGTHTDHTNLSPHTAEYDRTHNADGTLRDPRTATPSPTQPRTPYAKNPDGSSRVSWTNPDGTPATPSTGTPAEQQRLADAEADLSRGKDPKDTRTDAEKKADKKASKE